MMKRVVTLLVLMSFLTFGTTRQELIITKTLSYEGVQKYGQSVRGIELSTLKTYNKLKGTNWKLNTLKHWQAVEILKELYWYDRYNYINDDKVLQFIFDFAVNTSPEKAYRLMHKAFGLEQKPYFSLELVGEINKTPKKTALKKLYNVRLNYMKSLSSWQTHSKGWLKRLDSLVR